jgi:hypothetical protein
MESQVLFVLIYKTGYGSEGFPVGVFQTEELAKQNICIHEKNRSISFNESGVMYEVYKCIQDVCERKLVYMESRKTNKNILNITTTNFQVDGDIPDVRFYSQVVNESS